MLMLPQVRQVLVAMVVLVPIARYTVLVAVVVGTLVVAVELTLAPKLEPQVAEEAEVIWSHPVAVLL